MRKSWLNLIHELILAGKYANGAESISVPFVYFHSSIYQNVYYLGFLPDPVFVLVLPDVA